MTGRTNQILSHPPALQGRGEGTVTTALARWIAGLVQSGELPLGTRLPPERRMAEMLKVSRPSVRQVIKALEAQGIVVCRVGSGNFITNEVAAANLLVEPIQFAIRANNLSRAQLFEMRRLIEVHVTGLAALRATKEDLAAIRHELETMEKSQGNMRAMAECDYRFHAAIIRACGNPIFELLYQPISKMIWEDLEDRMHLFDSAFTVRTHRTIYKAIERRASKAAMEATKKHLDEGYGTVLKAEQQAQEGAPAARRKRSTEPAPELRAI